MNRFFLIFLGFIFFLFDSNAEETQKKAPLWGVQKEASPKAPLKKERLDSVPLTQKTPFDQQSHKASSRGLKEKKGLSNERLSKPHSINKKVGKVREERKSLEKARLSSRKKADLIPEAKVSPLKAGSMNQKNQNLKNVNQNLSPNTGSMKKVENSKLSPNLIKDTSPEQPTFLPAERRKAPSMFQKIQHLNILNTKEGFVPSVIRVFKNSSYKINIVNVNKKNKNVSFVFSRYSIFLGTYFGEVISFVLKPMHEGIYAFQCPETGKEGWMLVLPEKVKFIRSLSDFENLNSEWLQGLDLNQSGSFHLENEPSLKGSSKKKNAFKSLERSVEDSFKKSLDATLSRSSLKTKKGKKSNQNQKKKGVKSQSSLVPPHLKKELNRIQKSLVPKEPSFKKPLSAFSSSFFNPSFFNLNLFSSIAEEFKES